MQRMLAALGLSATLWLGGQAWAFGPFGGAPPRLNDIQLIGSHNSYKRAIAAPVQERIAEGNPELAAALAYAHLPLADQLDLGLRQLELDVFADPEGGRFAHPLGAQVAASAQDAPPGDRDALSRPGFKVFHIQDLDYSTHCPAFTDCLETVKAWSAAHPKHVPVFITVNPKTQRIAVPGSTPPLALTPKLFEALDAEIRSVFAPEALLTPDDVRGGHITLEAAILADGWPALEAVRGKVMFVLDAPASLLDLYRRDHEALRGRAMFANVAPGNPEAAVLILNDPVADGANIRSLVRRGYLVRTRSDADTMEARSGDRTRLEAAIASGAQIISTDYYPGAPNLIGTEFEVTLDKGRLLGCNSVRIENACSTRALEPRKYRRKTR